MQKLTVFKPVLEDWYGNYRIKDDARFVETKLIQVSLLELNTAPRLWRVCAWGNDDHGVEYDTADFLEAQNLFTSVLLAPFPTHEWFYIKGFVRA